jgi:Uma2 family endonuclease
MSAITETTSPPEAIVPTQSSELQALPPEQWPSVEHLVTDDGAPVDGIYSEKQMRLLTEPLFTSWKTDRKFVAFANVGLFYGIDIPPIVPDVMVSMDVPTPTDPRQKINQSYFVWKYGKPPEVAIEIVSNKKGGEDTEKLKIYANCRVSNYYIYDPDRQLSQHLLRAFILDGHQYRELPLAEKFFVDSIGLGLEIWEGSYENWDHFWLRWVDSEGVLLATGLEQKQQLSKEIETQSLRAEAESQRADREAAEKQALLKRMKELGIEP